MNSYYCYYLGWRWRPLATSIPTTVVATVIAVATAAVTAIVSANLNVDATATFITNGLVSAIAWAPRLPTSFLCAAGGKRRETFGRLNAQGGSQGLPP